MTWLLTFFQNIRSPFLFPSYDTAQQFPKFLLPFCRDEAVFPLLLIFPLLLQALIAESSLARIQWAAACLTSVFIFHGTISSFASLLHCDVITHFMAAFHFPECRPNFFPHYPILFSCYYNLNMIFFLFSGSQHFIHSSFLPLLSVSSHAHGWH